MRAGRKPPPPRTQGGPAALGADVCTGPSDNETACRANVTLGWSAAHPRSLAGPDKSRIRPQILAGAVRAASQAPCERRRPSAGGLPVQDGRAPSAGGRGGGSRRWPPAALRARRKRRGPAKRGEFGAGGRAARAVRSWRASPGGPPAGKNCKVEAVSRTMYGQSTN